MSQQACNKLIGNPLCSVTSLLEHIILLVNETAAKRVIWIWSIQFREKWHSQLNGLLQVPYRKVLNLDEAEGRGHFCVLDTQVN